MITFKQKEENFTSLLNEAATAIGCVFIQDSGEGHDLETDTMYLEDVSGWLVPKDAPPEELCNDNFYCFAEWRETAAGVFTIDFVKH